MKLGIVKETRPEERRVAASPNVVAKWVKGGWQVAVERGAGDRRELSRRAVRSGRRDARRPRRRVGRRHRRSRFGRPSDARGRPAPRRRHADLVPLSRRRTTALVAKLAAQARSRVLAMDQVPRISRAQKMDALSSMAEHRRLSRGDRGGEPVRQLLHRPVHRGGQGPARQGARSSARASPGSRRSARRRASARSCARSTCAPPPRSK